MPVLDVLSIKCLDEQDGWLAGPSDEVYVKVYTNTAEFPGLFRFREQSDTITGVDKGETHRVTMGAVRVNYVNIPA